MPQLYQSTLRNITYRLRRFRPFVDEYLAKYLSSAEAEDLLTRAVNTTQLYTRGIEGFGRKIWDYAPYRPRTIANKKRKGQPHTRVTLKDTGDFYAGFKLNVTPTGFYIDSSDKKNDLLVEKYGESIFRLTRENFNRFIRSHLKPGIVRYLKKQYGI